MDENSIHSTLITIMVHFKLSLILHIIYIYIIIITVKNDASKTNIIKMGMNGKLKVTLFTTIILF